VFTHLEYCPTRNGPFVGDRKIRVHVCWKNRRFFAAQLSQRSTQDQSADPIGAIGRATAEHNSEARFDYEVATCARFLLKDGYQLSAFSCQLSVFSPPS
jgi:hypothetical protein